ncbi:hypothetical protein GYMLUDRAFT_63121 [Collybiopsis luxurians FD-317 M1]|uniref:Uncharacterized protein n=1 Tax=Collybiopsis luxurians FD-317 M1 TaxID=944289 RepID=A0A0D0CHY9_9AGAR|nr:hypothetical protein GYMLUDRAFT_63121 [Collybiopsis luxurians FD-317 M1]
MFSFFQVMLLRTAYSTRKEFHLAGKLTGHGGAVLCLSVTEDGKLLASGGADGLRIWDMKTRKQLSVPSRAGVRGAVTAVTWASRSDDPDDTRAVFFGTQSGSLVCWKQLPGKSDVVAFEEKSELQIAGASEITGVIFDSSTGQLAVCNCTGVVQLYSVDGNLRLSVLFSVAMDGIVPKSIVFCKGGDRRLLVFSLYNGAVYEFHSDGSSHCLVEGSGMIGSADVDLTKNRYITDDPSQGVGLFRLDGGRLKTFEVKETKGWRPRQVTFADEGKTVVSGSDHGRVYVFDRRSGEVVDELSIGSENWVQTVLVLSFLLLELVELDIIEHTQATECEGHSTIMAARSGDIDGTSDIYVWRRQRTERDSINTLTEKGYLYKLLQVIMLAATIAFILQNSGLWHFPRVHIVVEQEKSGTLYDQSTSASPVPRTSTTRDNRPSSGAFVPRHETLSGMGLLTLKRRNEAAIVAVQPQPSSKAKSEVHS